MSSMNVPNQYAAALGSLSKRERQCLELMALGRRTSEIAEVLEVKGSTVKKHFEHIREKLDIHGSSGALVVFAVRAVMPSLSAYEQPLVTEVPTASRPRVHPRVAFQNSSTQTLTPT